MNQPADVPTIDISALSGDDTEAKLAVAKQIDAACRDSGFFYAAGHGINIHRLQDVVEAFHRTMTDEEKFRLAIHAYNDTNPHVRNGYYMAIPGKKAVESFCYLNPSFTPDHPMIRAQTPMHEVNWWPEEAAHPGFRAYCEEYFREMLGLSIVLLRGFALGLGLDEHFFDAYVTQEDTLSAVSLIRYPRLEHYPPVKTGPDGRELSFEDHQDVSIITVLFQTPVPNLQVETAEGWQDVATSGDDFLINCGTFMAHLTNGYYPAPNHRVTFVNAERLSLPFFVHAGNDSLMEPFHPDGLPESGGNTPRPYGEYVQHGLRALIVKNGQT
jgi:isopenicillin-N synthase